ncbi:MlaD family protein [Streptomyces sp. NPDC005202]|uniref:MlaD family protein n=1 Tax=Streptomyces sp. NPDC005202 TaxID=3157021 RepID=UPI0033A9FF1F
MLIGIGVLAVFAASSLLAVNATYGVPWQTGTQLKVAFTNVGSLQAGDDVRVANVRVGHVKEIDLVDGKPRVLLTFDNERKIYRNATAVVDERSGLGQKFIDVNPGDASAGVLGPDDTLPASKTTPAQDLSDVLRVLDEPTRKGLGTTVREVGGGAGGHSQDVHDVLSAAPKMLPDLGTVARALSTNDGADLRSVLTTANSLARRFAGRQEQLGELLGQLDTTMQAMSVDDGKPLTEALQRAPETLRDVRGALHTVRGPLAQTASAAWQLQPGAAALGQATPDVRGVLRQAVTPLNKVPNVAGKAKPAVSTLSHTFTDARPLAPVLTKAFGNLQVPLAVLKPYAPEIATFFTNTSSALSNGDAAGHWLRIYLNVGSESVLGTLPVQDSTVSRNAYPAPGQASKDRANGPLGQRAGK